MLERQHLTVKDYNKDQKAYASMLNKMYVAAKEGEEACCLFVVTRTKSRNETYVKKYFSAQLVRPIYHNLRSQ